jgi:hypothetical protein
LTLGSGNLWKLRMNLRKYRGRYGVLGCIKKAVHRIIAPVFDFSSNALFQWSGSNLPPLLTAKCPLEIRVGSDADLNLIASFHGYTEESPQIAALKKRLEQGDKPYLAFCGMALAHIAWVCRRREVEMGEIWGSIALGDNEAYIMDCHTSFIFRGKGIYPVVLQRILKDLAEERVNRAYIGCRTSNMASLKGISKAGFSPAKKIRAVRLFGKKVGAKTIQLGSG